MPIEQKRMRFISCQMKTAAPDVAPASTGEGRLTAVSKGESREHGIVNIPATASAITLRRCTPRRNRRIEGQTTNTRDYWRLLQLVPRRPASFGTRTLKKFDRLFS